MFWGIKVESFCLFGVCLSEWEATVVPIMCNRGVLEEIETKVAQSDEINDVGTIVARVECISVLNKKSKTVEERE